MTHHVMTEERGMPSGSSSRPDEMRRVFWKLGLLCKSLALHVLESASSTCDMRRTSPDEWIAEVDFFFESQGRRFQLRQN